MGRKILIVSDDFSEASNMETSLKKVGFDTDIMLNENRLVDHIITFNPDLIIGFGRGQKVSSLSLGRKIADYPKYQGKVILILPQGLKAGKVELDKIRKDVLLEDPVDSEKLIKWISQLLSLDSGNLLNKYKKFPISDLAFKEPDPERKKKYMKFLNLSVDIKETSHDRKEIRSRQKALSDSWDLSFLRSLDELKKQFTRALFRK